MRFTLVGTSTVLVAAAFASGCATVDSDLEYRGSLSNMQTHGVVLFEDGETGHAAMMDTTCVIDPDGGVAEDVDVSDGEESVLDGTASSDDSHVLTRVKGELHTITTQLDTSGWSMDVPQTAQVDVGDLDVIDARFTADKGMVVLGSCELKWLDSNNLVTQAIQFHDVGCTGMDPTFDVDRASGTAFVTIDGAIQAITPDGATLLAQGDLFEFSPDQGGLIVGSAGASVVSFVGVDGTTLWTTDLGLNVVDVADLGARGHMAVMVEAGESAGRMIELDATTGEITRQFDLPSPADMVISANGRTIAMVLPNAVHYYNLRDASL